MIHQVRDIGLGCFYSLVAAIWSLTAMYLEKDLSASVGQVLFVGTSVAWLTLIIYIISNTTAKEQFFDIARTFKQMFISIDTIDNIDHREAAINQKNDAQTFFAVIFARSLLGNIAVALMLLATSIIASVANLNAIYRTLQLLLGILISMMVIKTEKVSSFTLLVIVPLAVIGILLVVQPAFIFNYIFKLVGYDSDDDEDDGMSWIGVLLLIICALFRNIGNIVVKTNSDIEWYIMNFFVSFAGMIVGLFVMFVEYYYAGDSESLLLFFLPGQSRTSGETTSFIIFSNCILIGWGLLDFIYIFLMTYLFQTGNFVIMTVITTTVRILLTYLLEHIFFGITLNIWSYSGMIVIVFVSLLYNLEVMLKMKQGNQEGQYSDGGYYGPMSSGEEEMLEDAEERNYSRPIDTDTEGYQGLTDTDGREEMMPMLMNKSQDRSETLSVSISQSSYGKSSSIRNVSDVKTNLSDVQVSQ